jgi:hypothetical protein
MDFLSGWYATKLILELIFARYIPLDEYKTIADII